MQFGHGRQAERGRWVGACRRGKEELQPWVPFAHIVTKILQLFLLVLVCPTVPAINDQDCRVIRAQAMCVCMLS
eukprot:436227-Prymnesium_polylepis.2